ncbi:malectin domain-containing carbohydrate-binding protein [Hymenobacter sp. GOD-10R]|uniref:malectin domain-containing carbohydrate-binding protein n=1 Tax=Hymenobacter sp. GOD-10R TaxID=3093922 RepID=UPI002D76582A|nr:malectin domain-containing carbohydrate-binding protein [Hymenobacter sp. GOD-10R]WRQ30681.1 malectin domain-containing carbohydrate-binding protein [Hymenobacter sp. GOD-10R]
MKPLLLLPLLLAAWGTRAQTLLQKQSFENGEAVNYTANVLLQDNNVNCPGNAYCTTSTGTIQKYNQYFQRVTEPGTTSPPNTLPTTQASGIMSDVWPSKPLVAGSGIGLNLDGAYFWAAEGTQGGNNTYRAPGSVRLNTLNVAGQANLQVVVALMAPRYDAGGNNGAYRTTDTVQVQVRLNGAGAWRTIGRFFTDLATGGSTGNLRRTIGNSSNPQYITDVMRDFTFDVGSSANTMDTRVVVSTSGTSREVAFDNIRVYGTAASGTPPVVANIESTPLAYSEGAPATAITNTITVSDNDSPTLSSAKVEFASGFDSSEDRLIFITQDGITGSYNTGTGVLTLLGTAPLATYQAALRSVRYQNVDAISASAGNRVVSISVTDPTNLTSSPVTRTIAVTTALDAASNLPYTDDLETNGEGTRYASNTYVAANGSAWLRTNVNPYSEPVTATTFSNISGSYYWYGTVTNNSLNPSTPRLGVFTTKQVNTSGYVNLKFTVRLGATNTGGAAAGNARNATWITSEYFKLYYRTAGSSTWTPFGSFRGTSTGSLGVSPGVLRQDTDPNASTGVPTGTALSPAMTDFEFTLPSSLNGQILEFQMVLNSGDITNDFAFDNIRVTGTQVVAPSVMTATAALITSTSATLGGNVTSDGNTALTDRGVVYSSTNTTPTIADTKITIGAAPFATGTYNQPVTNLAPGTIYYVRAYATNSIGTSYGTVVSFSTAATVPAVTTDTPASITGTSAVLGGNVTATGGASITDRGVVYVQGAATPTISNTKVTIGTNAGTGSFSQAITGLPGNTTYTVRAYATNSAGTAYGASQTFTTLNNPPTANPDAVTVSEDSGPTVVNVLLNDTSAPDLNETLTVTTVTQPANGTATLTSGIVSFTPSANFTGTTTFDYTISDGNGGTATATVTVTVTPVNDAPVVTTTAGSTAFTPGAGGVVIDNGLTVADVDNTTLSSATVSISSGFVSSQDVLSVTPSNGVAGTYTFATGILALTGTATVAQYQAILRSATYRNSSAAPNTATRTVSFVVNDGALTSTAATKNITFAATTTVVSIERAGASPTNASTVAYTVTFASTVTGVSTSNFLASSTNLTGTAVASVAGSGASYTVTVTTGILSPGTTGSVQLQFQNSTGISPVVTNPGLTSLAYSIDRDGPTTAISSTAGPSGSSTGTVPIPFAVTFSESVTGFTATDITVTNGAVTSNAVSGSGTTYTFSVTPTASGLVTVNVPANGAQDAAGNGNVAAAPFSITYAQPLTAAPVITTPANNSTVSTRTPTYQGTAPAGSLVTVYVDNTNIGTTTATGGSFSLLQPTELSGGLHSVYATAQLSGLVVSNNSATITFTVDVAPTTTSLYRLHAGGGALNTSLGQFAADQYFSPSRTGANSGPIAGTTDDALYQTERFEGAFGYSLRVPNGTYQVVLHFAELYWTQPGQRLFDVRAENQLVLDNYDILKKVAPFTATTETFSVVVTDGVLNLDLSALQSDGGRDAAKLSALEVLSRSSGPNQPPVLANQSFSVVEGSAAGTLVGTVVASDPDAGQRLTYSLTAGNTDGAFTFVGNQLQVANAAAVRSATSPFTLSVRVTDDGQPALSATATVTVNVTPGMQVLYRLHAGGPAVNTSLGSFTADQYFSPSRTGANSGPIAGTTDDALYQTERFEGAFGYSLRVPNGTYQVVVHFAELYWTQPGQRIFDVRAENQLVLDNYDILKKVAPFTATTETFSVVVTDGVLNLDLSALESDGGRDAAKLSALEVLAPSSRASTSLASNAVLATTASSRLAARLEAAPNPSADLVRVSFQLPSAEAYTLAVYDLTGRTLSQQGGQPVAAGERQQVRLSLGAYPVGVYLVRLTTASGTQQVRLVKQ